MNACGALAASVRVLGCYQGLKIHPGGTRGSCSWAVGGEIYPAKKNCEPDKCLKRWQNVICWHLPSEGHECSERDGVAFTTFLATALGGVSGAGCWLNMLHGQRTGAIVAQRYRCYTWKPQKPRLPANQETWKMQNKCRFPGCRFGVGGQGDMIISLHSA